MAGAQAWVDARRDVVTSWYTIEAEAGEPPLGTLTIWAQDLDHVSLAAELARSLPALRRPRLAWAPLEVEVRTTLGGRLRQALAPRPLGEAQAERARQRLLEERTRRELSAPEPPGPI